MRKDTDPVGVAGTVVNIAVLLVVVVEAVAAVAAVVVVVVVAVVVAVVVVCSTFRGTLWDTFPPVGTGVDTAVVACPEEG